MRFRVVCSKGTYIRTLCHDIGERLLVGGVMESLTRSRVGIFGIDGALRLADIERLRDEDKISDVIISPDAVFKDLRAVTVTGNAERLLENGNRIPEKLFAQTMALKDGEEIRMYDRTGRFYGIYQYQSSARDAKPVKMFLTE